ncbi:oligosaccharide flippase family protein [Steroidobacter sp. S1-65]|uniref:Oligosaccharide flippase family protein n=1 Tax=Steroidobacter gossypii TaxID=2805490 RepID=A0ABS1WYV7_9GAMM|nr:oligosaccharide flippase family protein [Steroidobacter gossypii]MBM0106160.1 oligosaccharide flippase family protein [Steroidobacter gossypii]
MSVGKNIVANYSGALITAASPIIALPLYLASLGTQQWGLVSFATTLATLVSLLEIGLSQRVVRDLTLLRHRDLSQASRVWPGLVAYYWGMGAIGGVALVGTSQWLVEGWLRVPADLTDAALATIYFAAVLALTQIPNSLYRSAMLASGRHVALNVQLALFSVLKHGIGVVVVMRTRDLTYLYLSHATIGLIELAVRGWFAARVFRFAGPRLGIDWPGVHAVMRPAAKLAIAVIAGIMALQVDKVYLSRLVSLHDLGVYSVAAAIAYGSLQLSTPLILSVAPTLALASVDPARLHALCKKLLGGVLLVLLAAAVGYLTIGEWLVQLWLNNDATFAEVRDVLRLLLVGSAFNLIYQVSYQRWIVLGQSRQIFVVNVSSLLLALSMTPFLIHAWGLLGAAFGWIANNSIGILMNVRWMLRRSCRAS